MIADYSSEIKIAIFQSVSEQSAKYIACSAGLPSVLVNNTSSLGEGRGTVTSMSIVCLLTYFTNHITELHQIFVHVTCSHTLSILSRSRRYKLCTSGFVNDVIFSGNRLYGALVCNTKR